MFLQFDGVGSAYWAWLNGKLVGYAQDTFLCSEFDVTEVLCPGINHLAVQVSPVGARSPTSPSKHPVPVRPDQGDAARGQPSHHIYAEVLTLDLWLRGAAVFRSCAGATGATWKTRIIGGSVASTGQSG